KKISGAMLAAQVAPRLVGRQREARLVEEVIPESSWPPGCSCLLFRRTLRHMSAFVGRVDELASLAEIADAAVRGNVAAAVIMGDPGGGESRVLAVAGAGGQVWHGGGRGGLRADGRGVGPVACQRAGC